MHQIQFQHVTVGSVFTEQGIIGERTYRKLTENTAKLIAHENPVFYTKVNGVDEFGLGRINEFQPTELVSLINPSWGIGGCGD